VLDKCLSLGFTGVKRHHDQGNSYKGKHLIGALYFPPGLRLCSLFGGGLNRNGPYCLMCLNAWPTGNDTFRRCGLVERKLSL
jgi:hypothetical protein